MAFERICSHIFMIFEAKKRMERKSGVKFFRSCFKVELKNGV